MLTHLLDLVFSCLAPPRCRACGLPLFGHRNPHLCPVCAKEVEWLEGDCGKGENTEDLDGVVAVARYRKGVQNLVRDFKYKGETALAEPLARMMAARVRGTDFFQTLGLAAPVALHPKRRRERGFDQAKMLAAAVARETGLPAKHDLLARTAHTRPQANLHRDERLRNMRNVFTADESAAAGKRILLIDDVMTTGSTLGDCARACRRAGAAGVYALVFAR